MTAHPGTSWPMVAARELPRRPGAIHPVVEPPPERYERDAMRRIVTSSLLCVPSLLIGCASAHGAQLDKGPPEVPRTEVMTAEHVAGIQRAVQVAASPDGKLVAYTLSVPRDLSDPGRNRLQIFVVDRAKATSRAFTAPGTSASSPAFSPDGTQLGFLATRESQDDSRQVYVLSLEGGEAMKITDAAHGVHAFRWAPDGRSLAYTTVREADAKADVDEGQDAVLDEKAGDHDQLWQVDVARGTARPITDGQEHVLDFEWSPGGNMLAVRASKTPDVDSTMMFSALYTVPAAGGALSPLCKTQGKLGGMDFSPDGSKLAFLGAEDLSDSTAGTLYVVPAIGGDASPLTKGMPATGGFVEWIDAGAIGLGVTEGTAFKLYSVAADGSSTKPIVTEGPFCRAADISENGRVFACAGSTPEFPREVFAGTLLSKKLTRLTHSNPQLDAVKLGKQEVTKWAAKDGTPLEGVVTYPVDYRAGTRYPLVVMPHGGPEGVSVLTWNTRGTYPAQVFANAGYFVFEPNYRGSSGRGSAFAKADHKDLGGKEFQDVLDGIDHLVKEGLVDGGRVGMGGWSYGGYFSALAATRDSSRFKAAMVGAAITNWISFQGTTEIEQENELVHWNLSPWDEIDLAWSRSPMAHLGSAKTATLVVHGMADSRVPPQQAKELYRGLRHKGVPTTLVEYPREGHGVSENVHTVDYITRFLSWFDTHVKG